MKNMLMKMIILLSIYNTKTNNPIIMMLILILKTMMITMTMSMMSESAWFPMMLFLMMIGGLLIMFSYMTSTISNEKFEYKVNITFMVIILMIMLDEMMMKQINENQEINNLNKELEISMINLFNKNSIIMMMFMILYLFLTMIMVSKLIIKKMGPLRSKN